MFYTCLSVILLTVGGGAGDVCLSGCKDFPPKQTPPGGHPPADTPLADPPPPADGHCSGRYASYWNAFLSVYKFTSQPGTPFFQGSNLASIQAFHKCIKLTILALMPTLCSHFFHLKIDASKYKRFILQGSRLPWFS